MWGQISRGGGRMLVWAGASGWSCCRARGSTGFGGGGGLSAALVKGHIGMPRLGRPRWRADNEYQGGEPARAATHPPRLGALLN